MKKFTVIHTSKLAFHSNGLHLQRHLIVNKSCLAAGSSLHLIFLSFFIELLFDCLIFRYLNQCNVIQGLHGLFLILTLIPSFKNRYGSIFRQ